MWFAKIRNVGVPYHWSKSISEFQIPKLEGVKNTSPQERQSAEMQNCEKNFRDKHLVLAMLISRKDLVRAKPHFRDRELEESRDWLENPQDEKLWNVVSK